MTSTFTTNPSVNPHTAESDVRQETVASSTAIPAVNGDSKPGHVRVRRGNVHDAEELKRAFLNAASTIFAEGGLEAVSMRAVAAAVGVSPMTPYRYFADKAELLTGLWDQAAKALLDEVRAAVDAQDTARARARAHLETWIAYWEKHPDQYRLVYMTERTTRREDRNAAQSSPVYASLLEIARDVNRQLAKELGTDDSHVVLADEVRLVMAIGYLHATMINRRFPWHDLAALRTAYIDQMLAAVERIIVNGPDKAPGA